MGIHHAVFDQAIFQDDLNMMAFWKKWKMEKR